MRQYYQGAKGGALSLEASTYIQRLADWALYKFLTQETTQQCCYILAARQSGKTSLMIRIADKLQDAGYHCVTMNLQGFGSNVDEAFLCQSLLWEIAATFPAPEARLLTQNIEQRSQEMANYPSALQFRESLKYLMQYLRKKGTEKLIIFLDEIQSLISWKLQNSFLGLLRALGQEETLKSVKFVLLGVAKPTDILTDPAVAFNTAKGIELGRLDEGDCSALIQGLSELNCDPERLFQEILIWTGGKPFLTQVVCNLCIEELNITGDEDIPTALQDLLEQKLINNWRSHDPLSHFQEIERWFRNGYTTVEERIHALELYKQLLTSANEIYFDGGREEQINLIVSGLAAKSENYINVSNRLYHNIFNDIWVQETQNFISNFISGEKENPMLNREVFILVDQSSSMTTKDRGKKKSRWELMPEALQGDIDLLLKDQGGGKKICEYVTLYLFSRERVGRKFKIPPNKLGSNIFEENFPNGNTFVVPTLEACLNTWKEGSRREGKKAFIIIYTDGMLDDRDEFAALLQKTCKELTDETELKVLLLGMGEDVNNVVEDFLDLDFNVRTANKDKDGNPCNIFIFDLVKEIDDILDPLGRKLGDDPDGLETIPKWVKERHSDWYQKYVELIQSKGKK